MKACGSLARLARQGLASLAAINREFILLRKRLGKESPEGASAFTRIGQQLRELHGAPLDIAGVINRPQRDEVLIEAAGIPLDRALFPLLVGIGRLGPIGVVELADRAGRDHTTVSRQVAKLESLGLAQRQGNVKDGRVREAVITPKGKAMIDRVDQARERIGRAIFEKWDAGDVDALVRLSGVSPMI